ncbi:MAG: HDIG domain-containing protein [Planctomycetes bacterium]|nr:HDIG domain-containing protein [Planctomycetota bacterium]
MIDQTIQEIARAVLAEGGRAFAVGGYVRDRLLGIDSKDLDVEVHGLSLARVEEIIARFGDVIAVGRAFGVFRVKGLDADFSLPRTDSKAGPGHRGFDVAVEPHIGLEAASRRRDLTINSMALDLVTGEILDPHGGRADLEARLLRATDPASFAEDPLRGLRAAQLAARFLMRPDADLLRLCSALDLAELPGERLLEEFRKLLVLGARPSLGLELLRQTGLLRFFPELLALVGVLQEPDWHPEGDVWTHTLMVVDQAARLRDGGPDDEALLFAALCHDLGKPETTAADQGRLRSLGHDVRGAPLAESFLGRMLAPRELVRRVAALVTHHLAPAFFVRDDASARAYRRLARRLGEAGVTLELLERVARADHLGRTTVDATALLFTEGDEFLRRAREFLVAAQAPRDLVLGRHLIARGLAPGPGFGPILRRCREIQDETGWDDPERILDRALESPEDAPDPGA